MTLEEGDDDELMAEALPLMDLDPDGEASYRSTTEAFQQQEQQQQSRPRTFDKKRREAAMKTIEKLEGVVPIDQLLHLDLDAKSCSLCILNVGTVTSPGAPLAHLQSWLPTLPGFASFFAGKSKPYCFVTFTTPADAESAARMIAATEFIDIAGRRKTYMVQKARRVPDASDDERVVVDPDEAARLVPGVFLIKDFVTEAEEAELMAAMENDQTTDWTHLSHRKIKHYGIGFDYTSNLFGKNPLSEDAEEIERARTSQILPPFCSWLLDRITALAPMQSMPAPNQLTVNHYPPGSGIRPHVDTHSSFSGPVCSLSLMATAVMDFRYLPEPPREIIFGLEDGADIEHPVRPADFKPIPGYKQVNILLPRRSLVILSSDARLGWEHSIRPRSYDIVNGSRRDRQTRVSFTFRRVRLQDEDAMLPESAMRCGCKFWWLCDEQLPGGAKPDRLKVPEERRVKWW